MGHEEEMKKEEMELDAAQILANLADSGPISTQSSISQGEDPQQFQAKIGDDSKELGKRNSHKNQTIRKAGPSNSTNQAEISSLRGHKNLDETERDAKRVSRILANRESARQTILRRQAVRDELARKVSMLSAENLCLKMEKENATREYLYQKEMNEQLKEQMIEITPLKDEKHKMLHAQCTSSACAISNEVSCSLTLSIGKMKDETDVQKRETVKCKPKLEQLHSKSEWEERSSTPYVLLGAADARRRRMNIARLKQFNRNLS